jgi:hypothetical protein
MRTPWSFHDPETLETYELPINPDRRTSPRRRKELQHVRGSRANQNEARSWMTPPGQWEWQWEGVIRSEQFHDALWDWVRRPRPIQVTDHLGQTRLVVFRKFEPQERRPTALVTWRLRYRMTVEIIEELP